MPDSPTVDDRLALADLAAHYAAAVDQREFDRLRQVFTDDCRFDTGRSVREGVDAVIDAMDGLHRYTATTHVLGQQLVESVDGETHGLTYCTAHHLTAGDGAEHAPTDMVMHIRYHDRFVETDAGWRIAERRLELLWRDTRPVG